MSYDIVPGSAMNHPCKKNPVYCTHADFFMASYIRVIADSDDVHGIRL